jgi:hypothetical protein
MTQLIENKPPRPALIAAHSHFCTSRRRFVGRSFSSDITRVAGTRYRCAALPAACTRFGVQGVSRRIQHQEPNRNIPLLEAALTVFKINTRVAPNRNKARLFITQTSQPIGADARRNRQRQVGLFFEVVLN